MKRTLELILFRAVTLAVILVAMNAPAATVSFQNFNPTQFQSLATAPGYIGITNGASVTNLVSHGISAPGAGASSEAFGNGASGGATGATGVGNSASAGGQNSFAGGRGSSASGNGDLALGNNANASAGGGVAVGQGSVNSGLPGVAIGLSANQTFTHSSAIGPGATTTSNNQVMLGTAADTVVTPNNLYVAGVITGNGSGLTNINLPVIYPSTYGAVANGSYVKHATTGLNWVSVNTGTDDSAAWNAALYAAGPHQTVDGQGKTYFINATITNYNYYVTVQNAIFVTTNFGITILSNGGEHCTFNNLQFIGTTNAGTSVAFASGPSFFGGDYAEEVTLENSQAMNFSTDVYLNQQDTFGLFNCGLVCASNYDVYANQCDQFKVVRLFDGWPYGQGGNITNGSTTDTNQWYSCFGNPAWHFTGTNMFIKNGVSVSVENSGGNYGAVGLKVDTDSAVMLYNNDFEDLTPTNHALTAIPVQKIFTNCASVIIENDSTIGGSGFFYEFDGCNLGQVILAGVYGTGTNAGSSNATINLFGNTAYSATYPNIEGNPVSFLTHVTYGDSGTVVNTPLGGNTVSMQNLSIFTQMQTFNAGITIADGGGGTYGNQIAVGANSGTAGIITANTNKGTLFSMPEYAGTTPTLGFLQVSASFGYNTIYIGNVDGKDLPTGMWWQLASAAGSSTAAGQYILDSTEFYPFAGTCSLGLVGSPWATAFITTATVGTLSATGNISQGGTNLIAPQVGGTAGQVWTATSGGAGWSNAASGGSGANTNLSNVNPAANPVFNGSGLTNLSPTNVSIIAGSGFMNGPQVGPYSAASGTTLSASNVVYGDVEFSPTAFTSKGIGWILGTGQAGALVSFAYFTTTDGTNWNTQIAGTGTLSLTTGSTTYFSAWTNAVQPTFYPGVPYLRAFTCNSTTPTFELVGINSTANMGTGIGPAIAGPSATNSTGGVMIPAFGAVQTNNTERLIITTDR